MLTRIFADNFRALVNFELRPARLSLLLGDNGSGKTSVLEVLGNLRDLIVLGRTSPELFSHTRTKWEMRDVQRFELDFQAGDGTYRYVLEIQHPEDQQEKPFLRSESVSFDGEQIYRFMDGEVHLHYEDAAGPVFPFRSDQSFLSNLDPRSPRLGRLGKIRDLVAGLGIVQPNPFQMEQVSRLHQSLLDRRGFNFASFFDHLNTERPEVRAALEEHLRKALPGFLNFRFNTLWDGKVLLAKFGDEKHKPAEYRLEELSEGQRVLFVLYAAVFGLLRHGSLLCFDEPDNFVSLPEIQPWLQTLRDTLDEQGGQALIISHHPEVIDYLALDSVLRFERPSGPVIVRPLQVEGDPDLRLSDLIARGA